MRNRTWSDLVMAAMIAVCFATAAKQQTQQPTTTAELGARTAERIAPDLSQAAQSLAAALLLGSDPVTSVPQHGQSERSSALAATSAADRAMSNAAHAAGHVARDIEMPFFSFGGDANAE